MNNIIFDWSGVIKDAFSSHLWVVNRIFDRYGLPKMTDEKLRNEWEEPFMEFFNKYLPQLTIEEEQLLYRESVSGGDYPKSSHFPGIVELLIMLKNRGNYLAMISSDLPETILPEINKYGLENVFNDVVTKVHDKTQSVGEIITKNNLDKSKTYIVGDSKNEILSARNLGVKSIAVTWGFVSEEKLTIYKPDFVVHNLDELKQILINEK